MLLLYGDDTPHNDWDDVIDSDIVGLSTTDESVEKAGISGFRGDVLILDDLYTEEQRPPHLTMSIIDKFKFKGTVTGRFASCPKGIRMELPMNRSNKPKSIGLPLLNIDYSQLEDKVSAKLEMDYKFIDTMYKRIHNSMGSPLIIIESKLHHEDSE